MNVRLLVVGGGSIGRRHLLNAASIQGVEAGIFDLDADRSGVCAKEAGAVRFQSLEAALAWCPAGVVVATPHDSHLHVAGLAIQAGADVLIEKPIASREQGVADFLARAEALGRLVFVVSNMRYHPAVATLRQSLPHIGRVRFARAHYGNYLPDMRPGTDYRKLYCADREQGGVVLDGIHEVDYLSWLLGTVETVAAEAHRISDLEIESEDYAALLLRHAGGTRSEIQLDYLQRFKRRGCELIGSEGTLIWSSRGKQPETCEVRLYTVSTGTWETLFTAPALDGNQPYRAQMEDFLAALREGKFGLLHTGREAERNLAVVLAARRASHSGHRQAL